MSRYESTETPSPEPLGQPLHFHPSGRTAKNRFLKSPMAEALASWSPTVLSERGVPTDALVELYKRWGEGENSWGVIITGNIDIEFDSLDAIADMVITPECPFEGERFEKFQQIAKAAKANGSLIVAQVTHPGRQVQSRVNKEAISASDVQLDPKMGMTFGKPHAASQTELARVVEGFAHAAEYLSKAGFDGIELHAAHGYLISQFLSRTTNLRTDAYGPQTIESRLRLVSEIAQAIKARVPQDFIVAAKLNSVEFQDGGVTPDDARELCETLEGLGFDFVELSGGTYENLGLDNYAKKESTVQREGFFMEWAETITSSLGDDHKLKTYVVGGMRSVGAMVKALEVVDGIAIGRPAAAEPRLPAKILTGEVKGALKPADAVQKDFWLGMQMAYTQIEQVSRGKEPLRADDEEVVKTYGGDMGRWFEEAVKDGDKMEVYGGPKYSGVEVAYGTEAKA